MTGSVDMIVEDGGLPAEMIVNAVKILTWCARTSDVITNAEREKSAVQRRLGVVRAIDALMVNAVATG